MPKIKRGLGKVPADYSLWSYKVFTVKTGEKARREEVFCPFPAAAKEGVGAMEDEVVIEKRISDEGFRKMTAAKKPKSIEKIDFYRVMMNVFSMDKGADEGIRIAIPTAKTPFFRGVLAGLLDLVRRGSPLDEAMSEFPECFDDSVIGMVRGGIGSGSLDEVFAALAESEDKRSGIIKKLRSAMMYPAFVLTLAVITVIVMSFTLIPSMIEMFEQMNVELPAITVAVKSFSDFLKGHPYVLGIPLLGGYLMYHYRKQIADWEFFQKRLVRLPVIGKIVRMSILSKSLSTMSLLIHAQVKMPEVFDIAAKVSGHFEYRNFFKRVQTRLSKGEAMHRAMMSERELIGAQGKELANYMGMASGSGVHADVLKGYSAALSSELDDKAEQLPKIIEPILLVVVVILVGFVLLATYLPGLLLTQGILENSAK